MVTLETQQIVPTAPIPPKSLQVKTNKPRPYVCGTCTRSFVRLEHLKRHERSHTKEKPFQCPVCERSFSRRDLLLRHKQKLHASSASPSKTDEKHEVWSESEARGRTASVSEKRRRIKRHSPSPLVASDSPGGPQSLPSGSQWSLYLNPLEHELDSVRNPAPAFRAANGPSRSSSFSASSATSYLRYEEVFAGHQSPAASLSEIEYSTPQIYSTELDETSDVLEPTHLALDPGTVNPAYLWQHRAYKMSTDHFDPGMPHTATGSYNTAYQHRVGSFSHPTSMPTDSSLEFRDSPNGSVSSVASTTNWDSPMAQPPSVTSGSSFAIASPEAAYRHSWSKSAASGFGPGFDRPSRQIQELFQAGPPERTDDMFDDFVDFDAHEENKTGCATDVTPSPNPMEKPESEDAYARGFPIAGYSLAPDNHTHHTLAPCDLQDSMTFGQPKSESIDFNVMWAHGELPTNLRYSESSTDPLNQGDLSQAYSSTRIPTMQELRPYIAAYHQEAGSNLRFIHKHAKSDDKNIILFVAMASIGALQLREIETSERLYQIASDYIHMLVETASISAGPLPEVWILQAFAIIILYEFFNDKKIDSNRTVHQLQQIVRLARAAKLHKPPQHSLRPVEFDNASVEERWLYFINYQARIRTMYNIHAISSLATSFYGLPLATSNLDLHCGSQCPDFLWDAPSSEEWWELVVRKDLRSTLFEGLSVHKSMLTLISGNPVTEKMTDGFLFDLIIAIHAELSKSSVKSRRVDVQQLTGPNAALKLVRAWKDTRAFHMEGRPNSLKVEGQLADCVPLFTMAFTRAVIDIYPVKKHFFIRDFVSMNKELDDVKASRPNQVIESSFYALDTLLFAYQRDIDGMKATPSLLTCLFESALILSIALDIIESMTQPLEKHQELLMRTHKFLTRVFDVETMSTGFLDPNDQNEPLGRKAIRAVRILMRHYSNLPFVPHMLEAMDTRL